MMVEWLLRTMSADEEQEIAAYMSRLATATFGKRLVCLRPMCCG